MSTTTEISDMDYPGELASRTAFQPFPQDMHTSTLTPSFSATLPDGEASRGELPPKPDRSRHDAVKAKYRVLQKKYDDVTADKARLLQDYALVQNKLNRLQAEADMLIEQMHPLAPHISLAPDYVDAASDTSDAEAGPSKYASKLHSHARHPNGHSGPKPVLLNAEEAAAEEAIIEAAREQEDREKSYNPDGVKVRIGVIPQGFSFGPDAGIPTTSSVEHMHTPAIKEEQGIANSTIDGEQDTVDQKPQPHRAKRRRLDTPEAKSRTILQ